MHPLCLAAENFPAHEIFLPELPADQGWEYSMGRKILKTGATRAPFGWGQPGLTRHPAGSECGAHLQLVPGRLIRTTVGRQAGRDRALPGDPKTPGWTQPLAAA